MTLLARYSPHTRLRDWGRYLLGSAAAIGAAREQVVATLAGPDGPRHPGLFADLRTGLYAWLSSLQRRTGGGNVVLSAQICAAVRAVVAASGLQARYVDLDAGATTPSPAGFAAAIDAGTVAVVVAPLYGHARGDWEPLLAALGTRALVLDLAQGIGLETPLAGLRARADVLGYSFGVGKGLDTGGALLLGRAAFDGPDAAPASIRVHGTALAQALILRASIATGAYALLREHLDAVDDGGPVPPGGRIATVSERAFLVWAGRLPLFLAEIAIARTRAVALAHRPGLARLPDAAWCFAADAAHLRQLVRMPDAASRDALIAALRARGLDCAPAGEPLPDEPGAARRYPIAAEFRAATVRLPFLGRLTDRAFARLGDILEESVVRCLS